MKQFFCTWVEGTNGGYGFKHPTHEGAKKEAERLASLSSNDGKLVYVLCCLGFAKINRVIWEDIEPSYDEIPF